MSHFWGFQAMFGLAALLILPLQHTAQPESTSLSLLQSASVARQIVELTLPSPNPFHETFMMSPLTEAPSQNSSGGFNFWERKPL